MIASTLRVRMAAPLACMVALAAAACTSGSGAGPSLTTVDNPAATVFLTQAGEPGTYMEALYQGRIQRDENGCLRLEVTGQPATVVWPQGYTLEGRENGLHVKDAQGRMVGRVGDTFRLGGGFVPSVESANLSAADAQRAVERCPGEYWLAGPA